MNDSYTGRGNDAGPASDIFPLSAAPSASSPPILITGTTAAAQTTAHTTSTNAYDAPYMRIDNVSAASVTVYGNTGSTATPGNRQWTIAAGSFAIAYAYEVPMSGSGIFGFWATATAGIYVTGNVARYYTTTP